jgi:cell division protein FtsN
VKVRLEVIKAPALMEANIFAVQVGAFRAKETAERVRLDMEKRYGSARLVFREGNPAVWRVLVGKEPTEERAGQLAERIRAENAEHHAAFVVRWDTPAGATD